MTLWIGSMIERTVAPFHISLRGVATRQFVTTWLTDGLWKIVDKRQTIYARKELSLGEKLEAAGKLAETLKTKRVEELVEELRQAEARKKVREHGHD